MNTGYEQVIERVNEGILAVAANEEKKLDEQLKKFENLDEDDFEALRQKRKLELQKRARQEQDWIQIGHGRYTEITDTKEFFNLCKKSSRVVVHFYRSVTPRCEIVDSHFEKLAATHLETRFIKVNVEKSPYLVEKLGIILIPTMVLVIDGKTQHSIRGFDEFGGTDNFTTSDVAFVLGGHGVLQVGELDRREEIERQRESKGVNNIRIRAGEYDSKALDDDEDDYTM